MFFRLERFRSVRAERGRKAPIAALALLSATHLSAAPLPTTNQNPFLASVGLPLPLPAELHADHTEVAATLNWASTAIIDSDADEILIVDAETRELRLTVTHAFSDRLALRLELPYLHTGGGTLDGFIDDFHDAFGFSEGDRPLFRNDQLTLWYLRSGQPSFVNRTRSTSGLGDLTMAFDGGLLQSSSAHIAAWLSIGAPTASDGAYIADGDDWKFNGSLSAQYRLGKRWETFLQASATAHTGGGVFGEQKDVIWSGVAGIEFDATQNVTLNVQVQGQTAPFKGTDLDYLGDAVVLTVGGSIRIGDVTVNLGLSEDVKVEASPDAVFVVGLSTGW